MDLSILDTLIAILILAILPLGLLGVLANTVGADSRDLGHVPHGHPLDAGSDQTRGKNSRSMKPAG